MGLEAIKVEQTIELMTALEDAGYPTYIVGGAVRDTIMKLPIKDLDIATKATPAQVEEVVKSLEGYHYISGGQGAVSIANLISLVNFPDHKKGEPHDVEIATFRKDVGFERDAHGNKDRTRPILAPAETLEEDLERRDFTINAIAMDKDFQIMDLLNGRADIEAEIVRAVGKAPLRFNEDPVRMLRALRFSTRYGFTLEADTRQAIVDNIEWMERISPPRMRDEMGKVLMQKGGFQELYEIGILPLLMPELRDIKDLEHNPAYHPEGSVYGHYCAIFDRLGDAVNYSPPAPTPIYFPRFGHRTAGGGSSDILAWALLFHDIGKKATAEASTKGDWFTFHAHESVGANIFYDNYGSKAPTSPFEFSRDETTAINWVTLFHLGKFWDSKKFKKIAEMVTNSNFDLLCSVAYFDSSMRIKGEKFGERMEYLKQLEDKVTSRIDELPKPKGFGMIVSEALKIAPGPKLGEKVEEIRQMVISGRAKDWDAALNLIR